MRTIILAALLVAATAATPPQSAHHRKHQCSQTNVQPCIRQAARRYRQSYSEAKRVSFCESRWNPHASNGVSFGLWQFIPSTWASTPFRRRSIWSAKWSSLAAMWMWRQGRKGEWSCA
jgi:thioesterase domain-containing protein